MLDLGSGEAGGARGWVAGRAGLWGCPTDLGLGLLGSVPRPLSTQPPFATQALNYNNVNLTHSNDQEFQLDLNLTQLHGFDCQHS